MASARRRVTRAPLGRTAEIARLDEPLVLVRFIDLDFLALDEVAVLATAQSRPRHAEMRQFTDGDDGLLGEHRRDLLVGAPVRAAYRVEEVHCRVVAGCLDAAADRGLHAALG